MAAENISPNSIAGTAAKALSRVFFRGFALGIIWVAVSLIFFLAGMELARLIGVLDYRRDLTLMVLRVPVPGIWISFFVLGLRYFFLPGFVGGMAVSFYKEISVGEDKTNQNLPLLIGGFIGGLMAFSGLFALFLSVSFFSAGTGWLFALLFVGANSVCGALLTKWELVE